MKPAATVLLFAVYTACTSMGLLLFKRGWPAFAEALGNRTPWRSAALLPAAGAALYVVSFLLWLVIVSRLPLTVAYPVAIGLSLVAITLGAVLWLGEPLSAPHVFGAVLVLAGIVLLSR